GPSQSRHAPTLLGSSCCTSTAPPVRCSSSNSTTRRSGVRQPESFTNSFGSLSGSSDSGSGEPTSEPNRSVVGRGPRQATRLVVPRSRPAVGPHVGQELTVDT